MMKFVSFFVAMLVAGAVIMVGWLAVTQWRLNHVKSQTQSLLSQPQRVSEQHNTSLIEQRDKIKETLIVANQTQEFMHSHINPKYSFVLMGLGKSKVEGVWITKLGVEKEGQEMLIEGQAKSVESMLNMMKNLREQVAFKKAQLQILKLGKNAQGQYDFTMLGHYVRTQ